MTKTPFTPEELSAIMDDEESAQDLLHNQELSQTWARYQLIGSAIRQELPSHIDTGLSKRIAQYIEADQPQLHSKQDPKRTVISLQDWFKNKTAPLSFLTQGAIAAGVATLIIHTVCQPENKQSPLTLHHTKPFLGQLSPVSLHTQPIEEALLKTLHKSSYQQLQQEEQLRLQEKIKSYVQDYQEQQRLYPAHNELTTPPSTQP